MAYWRNYRKLTSEVEALAAAESSEDESIVNIHSQQNELTESVNYSSSDSSDSFHEDEQSTKGYTSASDSDVLENSSSLSSEHSVRQELNSWAIRNRCTHSSLNELLDILRRQGHDLPKDARTLLDTPRDVIISSKCGGQYVYFGIEPGIINILSKYPKAAEKLASIELMINVDGLPLFKSTNDQFWPILCRFNDLDVFVVGLFYGKTKPAPVEEYLHDFLNELDKLKDNGILYDKRKITVQVKCFCCDAPARCFLKCIIGHTGYFACERCIVEGMWSGRVVFNSDTDAPSRSDEMFSSCAYEIHQKRATPLIDHSVSCVRQFSLDYMHLVCLGVTKRIIYFLRKGPRCCKLSSQQIAQISSRLLLLKGAMPSEFARQPRALDEVDRWKATEFRQFLLYTGPIVLRNIVSKELYKHFLALSVAISIMLDTSKERRNAYLDYAEQLLAFFVKNCKHIYGDTFTVYNVHSLLHLADDVKNFGCSLNEISCFPFENYMQHIKKHVRSGQNPIVQVAKRIGEISSSAAKVATKCNFTRVGTVAERLKDSCFLLGDKFAFVKEKRDDGRLECDVLPECQVESFYSGPADSKLFKIVYARSIEHRAKRCLVEKCELVRKAVCLPQTTGGGYVIFPMHHEVERTC